MYSVNAGRTTLRLKNDISELRHATRALRHFGQSCRLPGDVVNNVILAFEEVFANIVQHGCGADADHRIYMDIQSLAGVIQLEITDDGRPFNPLETPAPDLDKPFDERAIGGLGIHLVRQIVNDIEYERLALGNKIRMTLGVVGTAENR